MVIGIGKTNHLSSADIIIRDVELLIILQKRDCRFKMVQIYLLNIYHVD